jgi:hypothetical protein
MSTGSQKRCHFPVCAAEKSPCYIHAASLEKFQRATSSLTSMRVISGNEVVEFTFSMNLTAPPAERLENGTVL